ncbi:MAG: maltotransferase domain-containing protein [Thermoplasmata archaeon]
MAQPPREIVIEGLRPTVDEGQWDVRRVVGDVVRVRADVFGPANVRVDVVLLVRTPGSRRSQETLMTPLGEDRWTADFSVPEVGVYEFTVAGWTDHFGSWIDRAHAWWVAGEDVEPDAPQVRQLLTRIARRASSVARPLLDELRVEGEASAWEKFFKLTKNPILRTEIRRLQPRSDRVVHAPRTSVNVERRRAAFASWYEMFPRSGSPDPGRSATFLESRERLPRIRDLGFDVVYLPPIHPIGRTHRRGRDNSADVASGDPGSPWAIGSPEGGHFAIHPDLGSEKDFQEFLRRANELGLEVALDIAFQCSPDHPWVHEHPEWFAHRPDGSIRYAENPPKRYLDIVPFDFGTRAWRALWEALRDVVLYWAERGVRIFRVDNPHTKPFRFWKWLIAEAHQRHPDLIFLAEAFTRRDIMYYLGKIGFSESYTYFTWRNEKWELQEYFTELSRPPVSEFFRPMLFTNTPDILTPFLQFGGRPAFECRAVLAATLSPLWGIYSGFENCERVAVPGTEEYARSEKYEYVSRPVAPPGNIESVIRLLNGVRREHAALQGLRERRFLPVDNAGIVAYLRWSDRPPEVVLVVVNVQPSGSREGLVELPLEALGLPIDQPFVVEDLLTSERWTWRGPRNFVRLDPHERVAHVFALPGAMPPGGE